MVIFSNVRVFDGSGAAPYAAEVRIKGNRIESVTRAGAAPPPRPAGAEVIDGGGATLMPGLTEAHAHLSWPTSVERFVPGMALPPEDLLLNTACNARILLDHGFTSAYSGGSLGKTLEVTLNQYLSSGAMPGPRFIPSSIEREPPTDSALLDPGKVAEHGKGPEAVRAFVKSCAEIGAKVVKFLLSGESALKPGASMQLLYTAEEVRAAGEQARISNVWLTGHAHCAEAVKLGARNGFRVLYHCTYSDQEAMDLLTERNNEVFVAPSVGIAQATLDATPPPHFDMSHMKADAAQVIEHQQRVIPELRRRGVRILPGGDYGFPFNPNGRNARDLELFVRHFGYTASDALVAATRLGGELMGMGHELGQVQPGYLADLLLVKGDPTGNVALLQDRGNLLAIMKDGRFHKAPATLNAAA